MIAVSPPAAGALRSSAPGSSLLILPGGTVRPGLQKNIRRARRPGPPESPVREPQLHLRRGRTASGPVRNEGPRRIGPASLSTICPRRIGGARRCCWLSIASARSLDLSPFHGCPLHFAPPVESTPMESRVEQRVMRGPIVVADGGRGVLVSSAVPRLHCA